MSPCEISARLDDLRTNRHVFGADLWPLCTSRGSEWFEQQAWGHMQIPRGSERESFGWHDKVRPRRPMDTLSGSYSSLYLGNPLTYLFNSTLCYVVSGVAILVVGVIITSVTFQNLDPLHEGNKGRYAGPVLMGAGILVMGRGAFWKLKQLDCRATINRHRGLWRRLFNWQRQEDEDSEAAAIYLEPTDPEELLYCDDPPSYAQVTSQSSESANGGDSNSSGNGATSVLLAAVQADRFGAITNPALELGEDDDGGMPASASGGGVRGPLQTQASSDSYPGFPPPPYEEVRHIHQTRI